MKRILMCPPTYFTIAYEINPWMHVSNQVDPEKAKQQWQAVYDAYISSGVTVELIDPVEGLPDMVFTANAGLIHRNTFVSGNFRFKERKGEEQHFQKWFADHGFEVKTLTHFQGGEGDALRYRDTLYMGYGFRSQREAHQEVSHILNQKIVSLKLVDPYFYDFDTAFCPVGDHAVLYYPHAFDAASQEILKNISNAHAISKELANEFVCNSVLISGTLFTGIVTDELSSILAKYSLKSRYFDMSEFKKSGGGIKCVTLKIK